MKRSALLFTLLSGIAYLSLSSYSVAPSRIGPTVFTGCGGSSCHGSISSATTVAIVLKNGGNTVTDNMYHPGATYQITITAANSSKVAYGYICFATNSQNKTAGSFSGVPSGSQIGNTGLVSIMEHTAPILSSTGLTTTFNWTAPATGTGNVKITAYANAVDGSGTSTGDAYNGTVITLSESPVSVDNIAREYLIKLYPNPATDVLHLQMDGINEPYTISVYTATGQLVLQEEGSVKDNNINVSTLIQGIYHLKMSSGNYQQVIAFVKE